MNVISEPRFYKKDSIQKIESSRKLKFVCETTILDINDQWINAPFALFYNEADNSYVAIHSMNGTKMCTPKGALNPFIGVMDDSGDIHYSVFRHDYNEFPNGFVDGGRDYIKHSNGKLVKLQVGNGKIRGMEVL